MNGNTPIDFDQIYQVEVVEALKQDTELNFNLAKSNKKYLQGGTCPLCGEKEVFIKLDAPYNLKCNRLNNCRYEEKTRDRYAYLFENLSERFPATPENPNASAEAYMARQRGFPLDKIKGWFKQEKIRLADQKTYAEVVLFPLANGYWARIIDNNKIPFNDGKKAKIKYGTDYQGLGWTPPNQILKPGEQVYIVEGIFHAIALWLTGKKVIAAISATNFPWHIIEAEKGKLITWIIATDNDKAGRDNAIKHYNRLRELHEFAKVALPEAETLDGKKDWDDLYRAGKLTDSYFDKAIYRGNLLTANSKEWKAYYIFKQTNKSTFLVDFESYLYTVHIKVGEYYKETEEAPEDSGNEGTFKVFLRCVTIKQDCNCIPQFEYIQQDPITEEQQYYFSFRFPNPAQNRTVALPSSALSNARAFRSALLEKTPGGNFEGNDKTLAILSGQWLKHVTTIKALPFVGYDEESGIYCYQEFGYKNGQRLKVNVHNFIKVDKMGIKTKLKKPHILVNKKDFNTKWFNIFKEVYHLNGLAMLAWWTASLFTQQIKRRQKSWPFLELTGQPGAGKSSLIRWLMALIGRPDTEGINPNSSTDTGFRRAISQLSNMPLVLIESDQQKTTPNGKKYIQQYDWDSIKDLYDYNGFLKVQGVKSSDNETNELIYRGSICIAQNESIDASEAILTRIVHLHATTDHHTTQLKELAEQLDNLPNEFLAGYLEHVLSHEVEWLNSYFNHYKKYEKALQQVAEIKHQRITLNHAQIMAAAIATQQTLFPEWEKPLLLELINHLKDRAINRQGRISSEPELLSKFWGIFRYLDQKSINNNGDDDVIENRLNHSPNPSHEIAINIPHMTQIARSHGQQLDDDITKLFPRSTTYKFKEYKKIRSRIEKGRALWCWLFERPVNEDN